MFSGLERPWQNSDNLRGCLGRCILEGGLAGRGISCPPRKQVPGPDVAAYGRPQGTAWSSGGSLTLVCPLPPDTGPWAALRASLRLGERSCDRAGTGKSPLLLPVLPTLFVFDK